MNHSYKKLVKVRLKIMILMAIFSIMVVVLAFALRLFVFTDTKLSVSHITEIISFFIAVEAVSIYRIVRYSRTLKNNAKLEEMEIAEYDERGRHIRLNASRMCIWLFIVLIAVAGFVASFFNKTVFFTLVITLIVILILYTLLKIIYSKIL